MQDSTTYRGHVIDDPVPHAVVRKFKAPPAPVACTSFIRWGELEDGFFIFPCTAINGTLCVVPNTPMLPWPEASGSAKKKAIDSARQASLLPKGGHFTVVGLSGWEEWFTNEVQHLGGTMRSSNQLSSDCMLCKACRADTSVSHPSGCPKVQVFQKSVGPGFMVWACVLQCFCVRHHSFQFLCFLLVERNIPKPKLLG